MKHAIILALTLATFTQIASAGTITNVWYVNVATGNDANSGSTAGAPMKTIYATLVVRALAGDTVLVAPGTYDLVSGENFPYNFVSGVALQSTGGAAATIIDATGSGQRVFYAYGAPAGTLIDGFTIKGGLDFVTAAENRDAVGGAIYVNSQNSVVIRRNIFDSNEARGYTGVYNTANANGGFADGGAIYANGSIRIENNLFLNNISRGGNGAAAIGGGIGAHGENATGGAITSLGAVTIINNTFRGNMAIGGNGGAATTSAGGDAGDGSDGAVIAFSSAGVINNIFAGNSTTAGVGGTGFTNGANGFAGPGGMDSDSENHNLFFNNLNGDGTTTGTGDIVGPDPKFISPSDSHILFASPARGAGTTTNAPTNDLDNKTRPNPPSIGAYEPAGVAKGDFNRDGKADIVLRNYTTGQDALWVMNGTALSSIVDLPALANTSYRFEGTADFNGNGDTDILLRNYATGQNAIWLMSTTSVAGVVDLPLLANTNYHFAGTGDFNGDGMPDIILRNMATGQNAIWLMNGTTVASVVDLPALPNVNYKIESCGDFNGDGKADIVWRNYATGQDALWLMNGTALLSVVDLPALPNTSYRFDGVGDFNNDGKSDILLRNYSTGQDALWLMNGTALSAIVDLPALPNTQYQINGPR